MVENCDMFFYTFDIKKYSGGIQMVFSEQLICLRKQKGMSQEQLGEKVGVTRQTVSKWELGETTPDMDKLIELSKLFGISIDELVGKEAPTGTGTLCRMYERPYYEYKSKRTFHGLPLVHVKIGPGITRAKGVVAVGTVATGIVTFGALSFGVLSFGAIAFGLIALGALGIGALLAAGSIAIGLLAFGGIAIGVFAAGGLSLGVYSLGGCAIGDKIAKGGYASATIAIGDETRGDAVFDIHLDGQAEQIKAAIYKYFPDTWDWIVKIFAR